MSRNEIETNDINGSRLGEQGPLLAGVLNRRTLVVREWTSQENSIVIECYLLS